MKRREFLFAAALAGAGAHAWAQPARKRKCAAVVIGVNKAGDLPVLRAAASGAKQVGDWLKAEGYEVAPFFDDSKPVKVGDVFDATNAFIRKGVYDQLVVYFAGHGFSSQYVEYWLLSNAPDNPNEAISLRESVQLARLYSGIPNVIFVSDACRSTPDSLKTQGVRGSLIFPTSGTVRTSDVDQFMATLVGDPSYEVPVDASTKSYAGIYTDTFVSAFARADQDIISKIDGLDVVPNKRLKRYLEREVPLRAQAANVQLNQRPDAQVTSEDNVYIARVTGPGPDHNVAPQDVVTLSHVASVNLAAVGLRGVLAASEAVPDKLRVRFERSVAELDAQTGFSSSQFTLANEFGAFSGAPIPPPRKCGFIFRGATVDGVFTLPKIAAKIENGDNSSVVSIDLPFHRAASALIAFDDGTSTVLAVLGGYVASVTVARNGVISVSYVPARESPLYGMYDEAKLRELHAAVATAARFGVFRIERGESGDRNAGAQLANKVRMMKSVDPTLGLYAAYAYADAGIAGQVRSVREIMRGELGADVFDTAMLSGALAKASPQDRANTFPFCPMLSQGWALLRVNGVRLQKDVDSARDHMRPALWTTFDKDGTAIVLDAMRQGRLG